LSALGNVIIFIWVFVYQTSATSATTGTDSGGGSPATVALWDVRGASDIVLPVLLLTDASDLALKLLIDPLVIIDANFKSMSLSQTHSDPTKSCPPAVALFGRRRTFFVSFNTCTARHRGWGVGELLDFVSGLSPGACSSPPTVLLTPSSDSWRDCRPSCVSGCSTSPVT